jgi:hypothetical protein
MYTLSLNSVGSPPGSRATIRIASRHCVNPVSAHESDFPRFSKGMIRNSEKKLKE